ncbi:glycoprotein E50C [Elephant endotheliotropic herpesvirus 5B]|nr:glycoprotein E50C [Elephant endotheliotropic herpesvirus 5B]
MKRELIRGGEWRRIFYILIMFSQYQNIKCCETRFESRNSGEMLRLINPRWPTTEMIWQKDGEQIAYWNSSNFFTKYNVVRTDDHLMDIFIIISGNGDTGNYTSYVDKSRYDLCVMLTVGSGDTKNPTVQTKPEYFEAMKSTSSAVSPGYFKLALIAQTCFLYLMYT